MLLVGLTGNIASGKSTVARVFAANGATIIDADVLAREAVARGTPGFDAVVRRWGKAVVAENGELDRAALGRIVFADAAQREELNAIVHPRVEALRSEQINAARRRGDRVVVCDIPLLFEKALEEGFDRVVLVDAPDAVRLERLMSERGLAEADARAMMASQQPGAPKRARAHHVIDNTGSPAQLERRATEVWQVLVTEEPGRH